MKMLKIHHFPRPLPWKMMDFEFKQHVGARQSMFARVGGRNYMFLWFVDGLIMLFGELLRFLGFFRKKIKIWGDFFLKNRFQGPERPYNHFLPLIRIRKKNG